MAQQKIQLDELTDNELKLLQAQLVAKVAERLQQDPQRMRYDRHGSGHSNSSSIKLETQ